MNKIRFGLIGCGDIAHIRYFYSIPHFEEIELVGIYDMNKPVSYTHLTLPTT